MAVHVVAASNRGDEIGGTPRPLPQQRNPLGTIGRFTASERAASRDVSRSEALQACPSYGQRHQIDCKRSSTRLDLIVLADEQPDAKQIEIFRSMSGQQRLQLAERLYWSARNLKMAAVRTQNPQWPEEKVKAEVRRIFQNAST